MVLATVLHTPAFAVAGVLGIAAAIGFAAPGIKLDRRAGRVASDYLTRKERTPIIVKSGGVRPWVWEKEIKAARDRTIDQQRRGEGLAASEARDREWLAKKTKAWKEYRKRHRND